MSHAGVGQTAMNRALLGACLLAAAGSLPFHALPLAVASLTDAGQLPQHLAGAVGTACMLGQLLAVLVWPMLREAALSRGHATAALTVIIAGLLLVPQLSGAPVIAAWFAIGVASGTLTYLALASAALNADRQKAFALRLAFSLGAAGSVALMMALATSLALPGTLSLALIVGFALLGAFGLVFYRAESVPTAPTATDQTSHGMFGTALLVVALFFMGQVGYWSYTASLAREHGIDLTTTTITMGLCKLAAALLLVSPLGVRMRTDRGWSAVLPWLLMVAMLALIGVRSAAGLGIALFLWEIAVNTLSVRLLALVSSIDRRGAARWLGTAVLLGTAAGPLLFGQMWAALGAPAAIGFSAMTVPIVALWMGWRERSRRSHQTAI